MYCPFQKTTINYNRLGSKVGSETNLPAESKISFGLCHQESCAAWDKEKQCCLLCRSHILKEI